MPFHPGLLAVAAREARWILRDPVARFLLFGVPVIAFTVLGLTFSHAVVRGLNLVAVDMDNSAISRLFIQTVAASAGITIAERANDLGAAASAIRAGRAIQPSICHRNSARTCLQAGRCVPWRLPIRSSSRLETMRPKAFAMR
jgi:ABC-2 type transport system permease protein